MYMLDFSEHIQDTRGKGPGRNVTSLFAKEPTHLYKSAQEAPAEPGTRFFSQGGVRW